MSMKIGDYSDVLGSVRAAIRFGQESYGLSIMRLRDDMLGLLNSGSAEQISAADWNSMTPSISSALQMPEESLYALLTHNQAKMSGKVNTMHRVAKTIMDGRGY